MSRPRVFLIKFDNQTRIFHNGQALSGHVYIENDEELEIDGELDFSVYFSVILGPAIGFVTKLFIFH